jgi:putative transposase
MATPKHRASPGWSYFVTTRCWQGRAVFQVAENVGLLLKTLFHYRDHGAYQLHEFVVMPNHIHLLLTPSDNTTLEKAIQLIKGGSSRQIRLSRGQELQIWQEGFHDWTVRDAEDWQAKVSYIRLNAVRAKLAVQPEQWPNSSASGRFVLDEMPARYRLISSGAKAPIIGSVTPGLQPSAS